MSFNNLHVVFFQVKSGEEKVKKILTIAEEHFKKREKLFLLVSDDKAELFLDELLWKRPIYSFLYHVVAKEVCNDLLVVSKESKNFNEASHIFNLTSSPIFFDLPCRVIYDFDDSTPSKRDSSKNKFLAYREKGCLVESSK